MRKKRPNYSAAMRFDDPHDRTPASHPLATILRDENAARVLLLRTDHIDPDPEQPRKYFDPQSLEELTVSVREKGILQPIIVFKQPESDRCMIIDGERRWRAAKAAGLKEIPALLRTPDDALEVALIGNLQRDDFNPIEAAEGLARLKAERGYTDVQLTRIVGKSRPTITELLALNGLPEAVKAECRLTDKWTKTQLLQLLRSGTPREIEARWEAIGLAPAG